MKFQVPPSSSSAVVADMRAAGYDTELLPDGDVRVWIFAHQSAFQAEVLLKQLSPASRLVSTRPWQRQLGYYTADATADACSQPLRQHLAREAIAVREGATGQDTFIGIPQSSSREECPTAGE